jgi:hypothetical protein
MQDTKRVWIWVGVIVIILLVVGIGWIYLSKPPSNTTTATSQSVEQNTKAIVQAGDPSKCASVNTVANGVNYETVCKNSIAWNTAETNLDINACNGLDDKLISISSCQDMVIAGLVAKSTNVSVCTQFTGTLNDFCVGEYWSTAASTKGDPRLCSNLPSSTAPNCEEGVLMAMTSRTSTLTCSLFTASSTQADCENYVKHDCSAILLLPLQQACQKGVK